MPFIPLAPFMLGPEHDDFLKPVSGGDVDEVPTGPPLDPATKEKLEKLILADLKDKEPEIGDAMPDGTIYAGISPDTNQPMFATPHDAPGTYTFNQAARYAKNLDANGHHDFHVPSQGELNVLWENRNKGKTGGNI